MLAQQQTKKRLCRSIECTIHEPLDYIKNQTLTWNPRGETKMGGPKNIWFCKSEVDITTVNSTQ